MRTLAIAASLLLSATLPSAAGAAIIINGGFEDGPYPGSFTEVGTGGTIGAWTVTSGSVDHIGSYWMAGEGGRSIDLSGRGAGTISQILSTVAGSSYLVDFLLSVNPGGYTTSDILEVAAGAAPAMRYTFNGAPNSVTDMGWERRSYVFTATDATTALSFRSLNFSNAGPALDDVRVSDIAAAVPETSTWAMMIIGMGAVGYSLRRRRRIPSKA